MVNLEQLRAKDALEEARKPDAPKGENGGDVVKKVPAMLQQNGLLGALAFALEKEGGYETILRGAIRHYQKLFPGVILTEKDPELKVFTEKLCEQDSAVLRAATREILAYLNYYRRFASIKEE